MIISSENRTSKTKNGKWEVDHFILWPILIMMGLGLIMVLSASGVMSKMVYNDQYFYFRKQCLFTFIGLGVMFFAWRIPIKFFYKTVYLWLFGAIFLLILTLTPLGMEAGGASRWLPLGVFSFQPLELAKLSLVIYLAYFFSQKQEMIKSFSVGFLPPVLVAGCMAFILLLQPDFGGAAFILLLFFLMSLVGGTRLTYLLSSMFMSLGIGTLMILHSPYRLKRWLAFLHPFKHAEDIGYQVVQSLYSLGSGGLTGVGLGAGKQKLFYLPEAHTDFILAVLGEELGFMGISIVFICLGVILFRSFLIALKQDELQDRLMALGACLILLIGSLIHLAVVTGAVPPKGLPMPFISYGGSSMVMMSLCVGILLNIAQRRKK